MKYYLAGPYDMRDDIFALAESIGKSTNWHNNASWLIEDMKDLPVKRIANIDIKDLQESDVLILFTGESTTGGMWVEFGFALALNKPTIIFDRSSEPQPCFATLADYRCSTETQLFALLKSINNCTFIKSPERRIFTDLKANKP